MPALSPIRHQPPSTELPIIAAALLPLKRQELEAIEYRAYYSQYRLSDLVALVGEVKRLRKTYEPDIGSV